MIDSLRSSLAGTRYNGFEVEQEPKNKQLKQLNQPKIQQIKVSLNRNISKTT